MARCEAEFLRAEERSDHDVSAGLELAVGLHDDAIPQVVEQEGLLGLRQSEFPRCAGVFDGGLGRGAGPAVVARDEHHIGVRLRHAGCDRADADLGDQFHVDPGRRVGVLEVVDQLGEILDRIDVVVGGGLMRPTPGSNAGSWRSTGRPCGRAADPLAWLCALRHLDLDVVGVDEVFARDAEATGCGLLDRRTPEVAVVVRRETLGVFPPSPVFDFAPRRFMAIARVSCASAEIEP